MNAILQLPIEVRLAILAACGAVLGALVNLACYRLAWHARQISPWSAAHAKAPPRRRADRLPIVGWLGLRREAKIHGPGFWIRPAVVELLWIVGLPWLYWWCCVERGLILQLNGNPPPGALLVNNLPLAVHLNFLALSLLIGLMSAATLIDMDEQTIPDSITIPGTLLGLLLAATLPGVQLPDVVWAPLRDSVSVAPLRGSGSIVPLRDNVSLALMQLASPHGWPDALDGWPGLLVAALCWWAWCLAIVPRRWYGRRGWGRGLQLAFARTLRHPYTWIGAAATLVLAACWQWCPRANWIGLVSALVGLAVGGGIIWLVRILGTAMLRREAMGFGDVTLMAMIGAFVGWQACPIIFFLAPFAGAVIAVIKFLVDRKGAIAYGPFLCAATLVLILDWAPIWETAEGFFALRWLVPSLMVVCMVLLVVLLWIYSLVRRVFLGSEGRE